MYHSRLVLCAVALTAALAVTTAVAQSGSCDGEFELCPGSHECVLYSGFCGRCTAGQYLCPDGQTCVNGAAGYLECPNTKGTFFDWSLDTESRLDWIVAQATTAEKIAQLTNDAPAIPRLGIPAYNWLNDDEHGVQGTHATIFPDGCGLGATWSADTLQQVGLAVGMEARGGHNGFVHSGNRGHNQNGRGVTMYAPNMNLVRDPRWGRAQEVYSEDPHLSAVLTYQFVSGGQNLDGPYMLAGACCKHYAAYDLESLPQQRYYFSADVDTRNNWETYLPVFRACVLGAQGMHVMCSYNAINGVPTCAEPRLLNGILRTQWAWDGFVVSDYDAWAQIKDTHAYCPDYTCAAAAGINAGMDQEGGGTAAIDALPQAMAQGSVTNATVDEAFRRLFRARLKLGFHDPPTLVPWNIVGNDSSTIESPQHLALARQAAQESMCLYKNRDNVLPLPVTNPNTGKPLRIALIGPQHPMEGLLIGNYAQYPDDGVVSVMEGILMATGQNASAQCTYLPDTDFFIAGETGIAVFSAADCCYLCSTNNTCAAWTFYLGQCYQKPNTNGKVASPGRVSGVATVGSVLWEPGCADIECADQSGFTAAVALAKTADVVIVTLGLDQTLEREGHDRADIALPAGQYALVAALRKAIDGAGGNTPLVSLLIHGGTLAMMNVFEQSDAIIDLWYPGQEGGNGLADVLFGAVSPAGRTPVTYYADNSQLPPPGAMDLYPNVTSGSLGLTYRFFTGEPVYPFGYGLSYTTFAYSALTVNGSSFGPCDPIGVKVTVTNTGTKYTSDEVVQLYVEQNFASVPVPNIRLAAFKRIKALAPGQSRTVQLTVWPEYHSVVYTNTTASIYDGNAVVIESGPIDLYVGGGQPSYYAGSVHTFVDITGTSLLNACDANALAESYRQSDDS